jgi:three-Cys-motif partner protein
MATPEPAIWPRDPHTAAKHQIIQAYLQAWLPKLLNSRWQSITYAEGFSGPGIYTGGEPGSPVIAFREARREMAARVGKRVNFVLVEQRHDRLEILKGEMGKVGYPQATLPVSFHEGTCAEKLVGALQQAGAFGGPIFTLLDSYGGPVIPFEILPQIAGNQSSEVLITFAPRFLVQFGTGTAQKAAGDAAFGGTHWQGVFEQPSKAKYAYLVTQYRQSLKMAGFAYCVSFEMLDEGGHELHLIFGTNSLDGLEVIKNAMWKVDRHRGVRYRDPRDPAQESLEIQTDPATGPLRREILAHLRGAPDGRTLQELKNYTLLETVYRPPHATAAVRALIDTKEVEKVGRGQLTAASVVRLAPARAPQPKQDALF